MLRARFGDLPGAAILSPAFSGSAGIINSGRKGLTLLSLDIFPTCHLLIRVISMPSPSTCLKDMDQYVGEH